MVKDEQARTTWNIDAEVISEMEDSFQAKEDEMTQKYEHLRRAFHIHGYQASENTLQSGTRGGLFRHPTYRLEKVIRAKRKTPCP